LAGRDPENVRKCPRTDLLSQTTFGIGLADMGLVHITVGTMKTSFVPKTLRAKYKELDYTGPGFSNK